MFKAKMHKIDFRWGAYCAPPYPIAVFKGGLLLRRGASPPIKIALNRPWSSKLLLALADD